MSSIFTVSIDVFYNLPYFREVARVVERITSLKVNVISVEPPDGLLDIEYRHFFADNSNLKLDTGWFVSTDLEEGIVKTVNKFKTN